MKITIEATEELTRVDGVQVRVWRGRTEGGVDCVVFVHRIAVAVEADSAQFDRELVETLPPGLSVPLAAALAPRPTPAKRTYALAQNVTTGRAIVAQVPRGGMSFRDAGEEALRANLADYLASCEPGLSLDDFEFRREGDEQLIEAKSEAAGAALERTLREAYAEALRSAELEYRAAQLAADQARYARALAEYDRLQAAFPFIAAGAGDIEV